jgi:hypothetical protein
MPQPRDRQVVDEAKKIISEQTEDTTTAAARRGISYTQLLMRIKRGQVDVVEWGPTNALRVWIDA